MIGGQRQGRPLRLGSFQGGGNLLIGQGVVSDDFIHLDRGAGRVEYVVAGCMDDKLPGCRIGDLKFEGEGTGSLEVDEIFR